MIHTVTMYGATCDNCNQSYDGDGGYNAFWNDRGYMKKIIKESDWHVTDNGKTYCPDCYTVDDDDNLLIKKERQKL
jgi:hypothetical protein